MTTYRSHSPHGMAIYGDERVFFIALGQRIAAQRKTQDLTQVEPSDRGFPSRP